MRRASLLLVGGALLCVGPPACSGSDDAGGSRAATCTSNTSKGKIIGDYLDSHVQCSFDSDCRLLEHVVYDPCTAWCALALRSDSVTGLYQAFENARNSTCDTCKPDPHDPYKYYPECGHAKASAVCEAGKCTVKYTPYPNDVVDAAVDADAGDTGAESDSTTAGENIDATTPDASGE